ncbi:MAG TPA: YqzL family protein [Candidatus Baltobacteraceae bacterium]|nr:YqzL family protein [Candidatus Baltobacteraceae bacterium]
MRTSEIFWKLFASTGSISAYLMYRHLHPTPSP